MDKNMFDRADLRQISSFILFREETVSSEESYEEQLEKARNIVYDVLKKISDGEMDSSTGKEEISEAFDIYKEIHTEIGMKLGARILLQLLQKDDNLDIKKI